MPLQSFVLDSVFFLKKNRSLHWMLFHVMYFNVGLHGKDGDNAEAKTLSLFFRDVYFRDD